MDDMIGAGSLAMSNRGPWNEMCQTSPSCSNLSPEQAFLSSSHFTVFLRPHILSFSIANRNTDFSSLLGLLPMRMKTVRPFAWSCRLK